ncbi:MAG: hypothetical protein GXO02_03895 [Epsilonproteobacteria bacterium]|nr:hypothetical protein [Campylobacterota bacterium]
MLNRGEIVDSGEPEEVINHYNFLISKLNNKKGSIIKKEYTNSYGTLEAKIIKVSINGENSNSNIISSGEVGIIDVYIKSFINIEKLNLGFLIKDRFGQDIFGTTTKNLGKEFSVRENRKYKISFKIPLNIGVGKYSLSVALVIGNNHLDYCLHYMDFALNFEIVGNYGNMFIGIAKLYPKILEIREDFYEK